MKVTKYISHEAEVVVNVTIDDICMELIRSKPEDLKNAMNLMSASVVALRAITDGMIAQLSDSAKRAVYDALLEQAARYERREIAQ